MRRIARLAAIAGASLFVLPAVAAADNLPVQVGGEVAGKPWIDLQGIYPKKPVVHVGDTIAFSIVGFHTIAVLPNGVDPLPVIVPTGGKFPATNDAAGNPFWWGGVVDAVGFNGALFAPTPTTFDGSAMVHSGGPAPVTVTFTTAGKFRLACEIHPFMTGTVKVVDATDDEDEVRPFAKQVKKGMKQLREDAKDAQKLDRKLSRNKQHDGDRKHGRKGGHGDDDHGDHGHHGDNHKAKKAVVRAGAGTKRFSLLRFYPADTTVRVGDSVTWKWTGFNEIHTVTFAPDDVLAALSASLFAGPTIDPVGGLPTEAPGAPVVHSATVHGNGLLGSGIVEDPGYNPPNKWTVQFTTAGDFNYVCLIHEGMTGVVHVTA
jgi:plastocyanin